MWKKKKTVQFSTIRRGITGYCFQNRICILFYKLSNWSATEMHGTRISKMSNIRADGRRASNKTEKNNYGSFT